MIAFVLWLASALPTLGAIFVLGFVLVRLTPDAPLPSERAVQPAAPPRPPRPPMLQ